jgi:hypothetical protein
VGAGGAAPFSPRLACLSHSGCCWVACAFAVRTLDVLLVPWTHTAIFMVRCACPCGRDTPWGLPIGMSTVALCMLIYAGCIHVSHLHSCTHNDVLQNIYMIGTNPSAAQSPEPEPCCCQHSTRQQHTWRWHILKWPALRTRCSRHRLPDNSIMLQLLTLQH